MCEYCEKVEYETKRHDMTPRKWFKRVSYSAFGSGEWHLFYRHGDDNPWYISYSGSIAPIKFCPECGRALHNVRFELKDGLLSKEEHYINMVSFAKNGEDVKFPVETRVFIENEKF